MEMVMCLGFYHNDHLKWVKQIVASLSLASAVCFNTYSILVILNNRRDVIVRQRAPWIAIYQAMCHLFTTFPLLLSEIIIRNDNSIWFLDGNGIPISSPNQISWTRKLFKFLPAFGQYGIGFSSVVRAAVVWHQYYSTDEDSTGEGWLQWIFRKVFRSQRNATGLLFVLHVLLVVVFCYDGSTHISYYPPLDWFDPKHKLLYVLFNFTFTGILEH